MRYYQSSVLGKILLRGDSEGAVKAWIVPDFSTEQIVSMKSDKNFKPDCEFPTLFKFIIYIPFVLFFNLRNFDFCYVGVQPFISTSVSRAWKALKPPPVGILDQLVSKYVENICKMIYIIKLIVYFVLVQIQIS